MPFTGEIAQAVVAIEGVAAAFDFAQGRTSKDGRKPARPLSGKRHLRPASLLLA